MRSGVMWMSCKSLYVSLLLPDLAVASISRPTLSCAANASCTALIDPALVRHLQTQHARYGRDRAG